MSAELDVVPLFERQGPNATPGPRKAKRGPREFRRAYKACIPCRKRKARCDLGDGDDISPPCKRCRRELRECVFSTERAWTKRHEGNTPEDRGTVRSSPPEESSVPPRQGGQSSRQEKQNDAPGPSTSSNNPARLPNMPPPARSPRNIGSLLPASPSITHSSANDGQWRRPTTAVQSTGLANSVIRTVVSSGNDALNLLFEAAQHEDSDQPEAESGQSARRVPTDHAAYDTPPGSSIGTVPVVTHPVKISPSSPSVLKVWSACRFVLMGWFTAEEAVTYVDLFFKHLSPLSPILSNFYADHTNHYLLITQEPMLCCTILMISSRYNVLPGVGGASRGYFIHHRLWEHCQHLIMRIMLGQEKGSKAKTRTIGSVEALLLMSEWHPRALHFPPASDGWDSDLILISVDERCGMTPATPSVSNGSAAERWLEDVIEPARRSDRMSWMLLGCALSLAHELGIFDADDKFGATVVPGETVEFAERAAQRSVRARKLLYVFIEQLSSRLGCTSMIPQTLYHTVLGRSSASASSRDGDGWQFFMGAWIELTKLVKSVSDMLFPSPSFTRQILSSGRYIGLLEHFQPLLIQWRKKYLDQHKLSDALHDMLAIEYQYVRIYTNSLGMQAVVERTVNEVDLEGLPDDTIPMSVDSTDYDFIQEVVDGSCQILQKVIKLADSGSLRYSPVRIFLRITSSSIYLIKGLSLGVWNTKLQTSLDILDRAIQALRSSTLDDMHLASRYATLLEMHVSRLRRSFIISSRPPRLATRSTSTDRTINDNAEPSALINEPTDPSDAPPFPAAEDMSGLLSADDWLALPFDASMAPFGQTGIHTFAGLDDGILDFIWNLSTE